MNQHQPTRPPELHIHPPEVIAAENGWVLRGYDPRYDSMWYRVANNEEELRAALIAWADETCDAIRRAVDHKAEAAIGETIHAS